MRQSILFCLTGLFALSLCFNAAAQPGAENRVDRWNDMWMNQTSDGTFGNGNPQEIASDDPCSLDVWAPQCEFPGGSDQQYIYDAGVWVGALLIEEGHDAPRVSTAMDGWSGSSTEFWSTRSTAVEERSTRDTVNCFGDPIYSPNAIADHELTMTFTDTLTDGEYVGFDEIDGWHKPLGLKITRTTYSMMDPGCNQIYWIMFHVENMGTNYLRNVYFGLFIRGAVGLSHEPSRYTDDLSGFDSEHNLAYIIDNDGRALGDGSGNDFTAPNGLGCLFLDDNEYLQTSFNWWATSADSTVDFGPSWAAYAQRDSLGMGWTRVLGTPMGDLHKYQLLSNGEQDYSQVYAATPDTIAAHPQGEHEWYQETNPNLAGVANGYTARFLLSRGPYGVYDYTDANGRRIYRLNSGASFDVWMAFVGGLNCHNPAHPQPTDTIIDPTLFDLSDLRARAAIARQQACVAWGLPVTEQPPAAPVSFQLTAVYPNPFNSEARFGLVLPHATAMRVRVFDILGREVQLLAEGVFTAGRHELRWDTGTLPAGVYFVEARTDQGLRALQKAVLLK